MLRIVKWSCLGFVVLFITIQLHRPARTNPAVESSRTIEVNTQMTPEVAVILRKACNDCHSYETNWPWYSNTAPVSWFLINHVNHGRQHLNFSEWSLYDDRQAAKLLDAMCEWVEKDRMPLSSYTLAHTNARLSTAEKHVICDWVETERKRRAGHTDNLTRKKREN